MWGFQNKRAEVKNRRQNIIRKGIWKLFVCFLPLSNYVLLWVVLFHKIPTECTEVYGCYVKMGGSITFASHCICLWILECASKMVFCLQFIRERIKVSSVWTLTQSCRHGGKQQKKLWQTLFVFIKTSMRPDVIVWAEQLISDPHTSQSATGLHESDVKTEISSSLPSLLLPTHSRAMT